jgi:hypothetical protein
MAYILKKTSGLINTRVTDAARMKMSQGTFNISYFQVGDSEVSYNALPNTYNQSLTKILEPAFNSQNLTGLPESNKQNVKYPYYVDGSTGNTYGIPYMDSIVSPVYNRAAMRGFFTYNLTSTTVSWSALTNNQYVINSNYVVSLKNLTCTNKITLIYEPCNPTHQRGPYVGDFLTIFYDGKGLDDCYCTNLPTPTPTPTPSKSSSGGTTTTTTTQQFGCTPTATPTPSNTPCITPSASRLCPLPPPPDCKVGVESCYMMMTYRVVEVCDNVITLDRPTPNFSFLSSACYGRVLIYPPNMNEIYDSYTPRPHWNDDVINFESVNTADEFDVKIWNMNIPWSENPAGLIASTHKDYTNFGSVSYLGTKEYLGYASSSGQTDTDYVYYYNSFDEKIQVTPEEQKAIAVIHYTNQTIDFFYGEKFALEPFDPSNPDDTIGQARSFKLHIPWLMWHKNPNCCNGQTFWVDPPGFDDLTKQGSPLFKVEYLESKKNLDMNVPGIRYYHLWDDNPNSDGYPSRIGKVFPDQKIIIIDDEEIIAAMSYKSNRNWTLPAPKLSLITPNICGTDSQLSDGLLEDTAEYLHVTYRLSNTGNCINSLHCNYYGVLQGPNVTCLPITSQNVAIRFGDEFPCLTQAEEPPTQPCYCWEVNWDFGGLIDMETNVTAQTTNCSGLTEIKTFYEFGKITGITETVCSQTSPISEDYTFSVTNLGLCSEVENCGIPKNCYCFMVNIDESPFVGNVTFTDCSGSTKVIGIYEEGEICSSTIPTSNLQITVDFNYECSNCENITPECQCWQIGIKEAAEPTFEASYINCDGNEIVGIFPVGPNNLVCSKTVPTSSAFDFYVNSQGSSCENCQVSEFELRPFGAPPVIDGWSGVSNGNGSFDETPSPTPIIGAWEFISPTQLLSCPGGSWFYLKKQFLTTGSITVQFDWESTESTGQAFYYVGNDEPVDDTNIDFNQNVFGENDFSSAGTITITYTSGQWISIGVYSPNCSGQASYLYIDIQETPTPTTTTTTCSPVCDVYTGFYANKFEIICQKVDGNGRPLSDDWKIIDYTSQLTASTINGYITKEGIVGTTFVITKDLYDNAPLYDLNDYINLTPVGYTGTSLNFGDEYYFYGSLETDIQSTIYEMRYKINLGQAEFQSSSNPTWTPNTKPYVTEIALYDSDKTLMIVSKLQSPVLRQGIQQFLVKIDF